eukprot:5915714-Heterocapsa_arctica.AAC.1
MNGKIYQLNVEDVKDKDCIEETIRQWRKLDRVQHAFFLKLKHGGKELDPRAFDETERAEFLESDRAEWQQWLDNGVVRLVPEHEASRIP